MTDGTSELYSLDPDDFVAARDALAKQLRKEGDAAAASAVKALRRPTVAVWLLNLVARSVPELVERARELAGALREAQDRALGGGDGSALRDLTGRRRTLVGDVVRSAVEMAAQRDRDVTAATRDAVASSVEAALADDRLMADWATGALREVGEPSGFNFGSAVPVGPRASSAADAPAAVRPAPSAPARAARPRSDDPAEDGERRLREASAKAARLRAEAEEAKAEVEVRKAAWVEADRSAKAARQELREAERAASRADLFAATAEQAAWEMGERTRR